MIITSCFCVLKVLTLPCPLLDTGKLQEVFFAKRTLGSTMIVPVDVGLACAWRFKVGLILTTSELLFEASPHGNGQMRP